MGFNPRKLKAIGIIAGTKTAVDGWKDIQKAHSYPKMFKQKAEGNLDGVDVGLPCKLNNLLIVDIDVSGEGHEHDGTQWWTSWIKGKPEYHTMVVTTPSTGKHYYYYIPDGIDPAVISPPANLAPGVDIKWDGYVLAPPTPGYEMGGKFSDVAPIPNELLIELEKNKTLMPVYSGGGTTFYTPFPESSIPRLLLRIKRAAKNNALNYAQWRNGVFALRAGILDQEKMEECIEAWTRNKAFQEGDVEKALNIAYKSDPTGNIGPGTIIKMLDDVLDVGKKELITVKHGDLPKSDDFYNNPDIIVVKKKNAEAIQPSETNAAYIIGQIFNEKGPDIGTGNINRSLYFDSRKRAVMYKGDTHPQALDKVLADVISLIQGHYRMYHFRPSVIKQGLQMVILNRFVDPLKQQIEKVKWDGKPRLKRLFLDYAQSEGGDIYLENVGLFFLRSLCYRILNPGVKCDTILILKSDEGFMKSTFCEDMGQGYYYSCGQRDAFDDKDCLIQMQRSAVTELPELIPFAHVPDETVKDYLSKRADAVRMPYDRLAYDHPRSFIMIGTTNHDTFLNRGMGRRRFLPVAIHSIKRDKLRDDIPQFMAEAKEHYYSGEQLHTIFGAGIPQHEQTRFIREDQYERLLPYVEECVGRGREITIDMVRNHLKAQNVAGMHGLTAKLQNEIKLALKHIGFKEIPNKPRHYYKKHPDEDFFS